MKILPPRPDVVYKAGNVADHRLPTIQWPWTDDTHMAIGVYRNLRRFGQINQRELATEFATNFKADQQRGYGKGTAKLLFTYLYDAENWKEHSENWWGPKVGSRGNGSAMRDSIIGSFFGSDLDTVSENARASAEVTHFHPEAIAGSIAVAVAAAVATFGLADYWTSIYEYTPSGAVRDAVKWVAEQDYQKTSNWDVVNKVGNGANVTALDTVPFALWQAHQSLLWSLPFSEVMNSIVEVGGDTDTVAAMVGGIIGNVIPPPQEMIDRTETLPSDI